MKESPPASSFLRKESEKCLGRVTSKKRESKQRKGRVQRGRDTFSFVIKVVEEVEAAVLVELYGLRKARLRKGVGGLLWIDY